ncbi:hypothetical protein MUN77_05795 [Leucobacter allii]|uniref:hypothetical protein n=1 Tax=Leucobacter allii TaxID=2932247 RepID=UPI001FD2F167|nr:hypothetical protein [Leucobacter allii]UOR02821.1 hypothetical protein MUN77_05795 [Leucobacter allii]
MLEAIAAASTDAADGAKRTFRLDASPTRIGGVLLLPGGRWDEDPTAWGRFIGDTPGSPRATPLPPEAEAGTGWRATWCEASAAAEQLAEELHAGIAAAGLEDGLEVVLYGEGVSGLCRFDPAPDAGERDAG